MILQINANHPEPHKIQRVAGLIQRAKLVAIPGDSGLCLVALAESKKAVGSLRDALGLRERDSINLWVADLSMASRYAEIDNQSHRELRRKQRPSISLALPAHRQSARWLVDRHKQVSIEIPSSPWTAHPHVPH